jgi:hypothetical protein
MDDFKKLSIDKEKNPDYYSIIEKHNLLMNKWNKVNGKIHALKFLKLFLWKNKKKLKEIYIELGQLEKEFIAWNNVAYPFITEPSFALPSCPESDLMFLHLTANLRDLRNKMNDNMRLIENNYNRIKDWENNQLNFIIAIISFVMTFIGLLWTFNPHSNTVINSYNGVQGLKQTNAVLSDTSKKYQSDSTEMKLYKKKELSHK